MTQTGRERPRRRTEWQVLIVEDERWVADIYARAVSSMSRFAVAGIVHSAEEALEVLKRQRIDLLLLDLELAGVDGLSLLRHLRASGSVVEVIALTASRDPAAVRAVIQHGGIDYLVKPFALERLRQALGLFLNRAAALSGGELSQDAIDRVSSAGRQPPRWLPKGLASHGLVQVRAVLAAGAALSAADVADRTGMARVTARRYLEYLVVTDQATFETAPTGPGRPRKLYRVSAESAGVGDRAS
jgi:response regulator of citrate/malate metabolism